jgi:hypothetical protein
VADDLVAADVESLEQLPEAAQRSRLVEVEHHRLALAPEQAAVDDLVVLFDDDPHRQHPPEVAVQGDV